MDLRRIARLALAMTLYVATFAAQTAADTSSSLRGMRVTMEDLGPIGRPIAINNRGEIVSSYGFFWSREDGIRTILRDDGGPVTPLDINDNGVVVGVWAACFGEDCDQRGFTWTLATGFRDLGSFVPRAVNNRGEMAGTCVDDFDSSACVLKGGVVQPIPLPDDPKVIGLIEARAINEVGDVLGLAAVGDEDNSESAAFVMWRNAGLQLVPGHEEFEPTSLNDSGMLAGLWRGSFAFWTRSGGIVRLPRVHPDAFGVRFASGLSNDGLMVGVEAAAGAGDSDIDRRPHWATVWDTRRRDGVTLPDLGFSSLAFDISDRHQIIGVSKSTATGQEHAVIWTLHSELSIETANTASRWGLNTRQRLAWTYEGDAPQFRIEISRDGGTLWDLIEVVPNRGGPSQNFYWTVIGPPSPNTRLRVTAVGDEEATDTNDADIRIAPALIEFVLPYRKTVLRFGTEFRLFWKHNLGAGTLVAIDSSADGGMSWRTLAERTTKGSTTSSFRWIVDLLPTNRAQLRIRALDGSGAKGLSEPFAVETVHGLSVLDCPRVGMPPALASMPVATSSANTPDLWRPLGFC
jgi:hypothetical protein